MDNLREAVSLRDAVLVKRALQNTSRFDLDSEEGGKILWIAVMNDEMDIAESLVRAGANVNEPMPDSVVNKSLLHHLVCSVDPRHHRLAILMMDHDADVNALDEHANAPLHDLVLANHSYTGLARELLERGARVDDHVIFRASLHPLAVELIPMLIEAGSRHLHIVHKRNRALIALRSLALYNGNEKDILPVVKVILRMDLEIDRTNNDMHILYLAIRRDKVIMAEMMMRNGFDKTRELRHGHMPVHSAAISGSLRMLKLLMREGANFNVVDSIGATPLSLLPESATFDDRQRLVVRQLALSVANGSQINSVDRETIDQSIEITSYMEGCVKELENMKKTMFTKDITFFFVLSGDPCYLAFLSRRAFFLERYGNVPREEKFPIYHEDMDNAFKHAQECRKILSKKELALHRVLGNILPNLPLERIFYYLYMNDDLNVNH